MIKIHALLTKKKRNSPNYMGSRQLTAHIISTGIGFTCYHNNQVFFFDWQTAKNVKNETDLVGEHASVPRRNLIIEYLPLFSSGNYHLEREVPLERYRVPDILRKAITHGLQITDNMSTRVKDEIQRIRQVSQNIVTIADKLCDLYQILFVPIKPSTGRS